MKKERGEEAKAEKVFPILNKYTDNFSKFRDENQVCLLRCTDKLNSPSEELTCYEKCEEKYFNSIVTLKESLYNDMNKIFI
jgi:hypothetical protein